MRCIIAYQQWFALYKGSSRARAASVLIGYKPRPVLGLCVVLNDVGVDAADAGRAAARPPEEPVAAEVHRVLVLRDAFAVQAHLRGRRVNFGFDCAILEPRSLTSRVKATNNNKL